MDVLCFFVSKKMLWRISSIAPRISSETVGETWENSSASPWMLQQHSTALTLLAFGLLRMTNPWKAKRKIGDKTCAITKRESERNCCALGSVNHGLSGRQLLPQPERLLKGFITISGRVKFRKISVLVKHLMESKLKWTLFTRVNSFGEGKKWP